MRKRWKVLLVTLVALAGLGIFAYTFAIQLSGLWFKFTIIDEDNRAVLEAVPSPRSLEPSGEPGEVIVSSGLRFVAPASWGLGQRDEEWGVAVNERFDFESGRKLLVAGPEHEAVQDVATTMTADTQGQLGDRAEDYREWIFAGGDETNLHLYGEIARTTPDDLRLFVSRQEALRNSILLINKLALTGVYTPVYEIQTGHVQGFQFGDPAISRGVEVVLFDEDDQGFRIIFVPGKDNPNIPSSEVDLLLSTIEPIQ